LEEVSIYVASISWEDLFVKIRNKAIISSSLILFAILILDSYVARSLCNTIPRNIVVTAENKYLYIMEEHAKKVGTRIIKANPEEINDESIRSFSYLNFKLTLSDRLPLLW
jgi:hypothetical protein